MRGDGHSIFVETTVRVYGGYGIRFVREEFVAPALKPTPRDTNQQTFEDLQGKCFRSLHQVTNKFVRSEKHGSFRRASKWLRNMYPPLALPSIL